MPPPPLLYLAHPLAPGRQAEAPGSVRRPSAGGATTTTQGKVTRCAGLPLPGPCCGVGVSGGEEWASAERRGTDRQLRKRGTRGGVRQRRGRAPHGIRGGGCGLAGTVRGRSLKSRRGRAGDAARREAEEAGGGRVARGPRCRARAVDGRWTGGWRW
jgi:hypothetical protein